MNKLPCLPVELLQILDNQFSFPTKPLFSSVATFYNHYPRIRTMRIYDIDQEGGLIFLTHTKSNKWKEFVEHPHVSIKILSDSKLLQMIISGRLILKTSETASEAANRYWSMVRSDVKKIYDPKYKIEQLYDETDNLINPEDVPNTFGIASLIPNFCEILQLENEYTRSHRHQFQLEKGIWQKQRIHVG